MFPQETTGKARKVPRKGNWSLLIILMMKMQIKDIQETSFASTTDQCTTLKALIKKAKQKKSKHFDKKKSFTKHEVNVMVQKQVKKALKQKKRKHTEEPENECF